MKLVNHNFLVVWTLNTGYLSVINRGKQRVWWL